MKIKISIILCCFFLTISCATKEPLYDWDNYSETSYLYLKNASEESRQELIQTYERIIETQGGERNTVPPGVYADLGFLLFLSNKKDQGKTMLLKEMELYPESTIFITRILTWLE